MTPDRAASDSCRRSPTTPQPLRPGFVPGRNHSGGTGRRRRFATALLIALAAALSGVPAVAQSQLLTAQFENAPASHNGISHFTVHLVFSENVNLSATAISTNGLLTITGGTLKNQGRLMGSLGPRGWRIDVDPDGTGDVTITLPAGVAGVPCDDQFTPCTSDGRKLSAPASVTVRGSTPWVTGSMSFTAAENQAIPTEVAPLTASDIKTPNGPFTWSIPAGAAGGADRDKFRVRPNTGVLLFTSAKDFENPDDADSDGIYAVTVQVRDGDSYTRTADLTVTLTDANDAPTANAGADQTGIAPGATVTLSGSGSDPDAGDTLSYAWTQTGEPMVELTDANAATTTFTAPAALTTATTLTFRLRVTDAGDLYDDDTVTVTGGQAAQPPVITGATSLTAAENQTAVATLTATDADTPDANLTWSIPSGLAGGADAGKFTLSSTGVLAFASAKDFENPDDADTDGIYEVTVQVRDGDSLTGTADLTVTLTDANDAPTANAGADQTGIAPGATVTLSGSGSDPDAGDTLSYAWTQTGSQVGTLTNANAATATFTAPAALTEATTLTFRLRVTDAGDLYDDDTMTVTGGQAPQPPVITGATSLTAAENQTAVATLTATDADTSDANLTWSIPSGPAGGADAGKFTLSADGALAFASAKDFENPDDADTNGSYAVTVEVGDGALTDTADLTVTLTDANEAPTANAGADQTGIAPGAVVMLSGSGRDPDAGDTLSYAWTQTGSQVGRLTNANATTATFTAPAAVTEDTTLTFTLRVTDADGLSHEDSVTVTVTVLTPLTAQFENAPARHDGSTVFSVHLRFSENVRLNSGAFKGGLLTITGGTVKNQGRLMSGSSVGWRIDVTPNGDADVVITLPANRACDPDTAPCTLDGRRLSAPASVTVGGPNPVPVTVVLPLTAQFENAPARHDGSSEFTVHLRFSENVRLNSGAFDGELLTITGGRVTGKGRLMSGSSVGWRIDVTPDGDADVVITLPANRACDPDTAPCTLDGRRLSAPASVTVGGPNPSPEVTGSTSLTAAENQTAVANLTGTDDVTSPGNLRWSIPSGAAGGADGGKFRLGPNTGVLAFASAKDFESPDDADMNGIYAVTVRVRDGGGLTATADLTVTLTNVNEAPTADAGADRTGIAPGTAATLSGSGSDPDAGDTLSYAWTQTGGAMGSLTNANAATATFTVPAGLTETTTFTFRLRVTDADGLYREDTVNVMVGGPVITSATSFEAAENQTAVATLTATDADTPDANLTWSIPSGAAGGADGGRFTLSSTGVLAFASAKDFENPDDADTNGSYEVTVEVSDGALKATADLTVTLTDVNEAPAADAGSNQFGVGPGRIATLTGSGSDPEDRQRVSYAWTQTGGVTVSLTDADTAQVTFTVPSDSPGSATFTFKLRVTDSTGLYSEDTAKVTVRATIPGQTTPRPPVITSATSLTAAENQTAVATLTATDADTPLADLAWSIPAGIAGGADGSRFTLSTAGDLEFASTKDFENPDNADRNGSYEVFVEVSDGDQAAIGYLTVTLTNVNEAPTADAGPNQFAVRPGQAVTLTGSGSDPDAGGTLSYAWTQTGSQVGRLTGANAATATFTAPAAVTQATTLTFTLRVTDTGDLYGEDTVTVTVVPQPPVITSATSLTAAENQTAVATLMATDADTPDANLTWSIPADAAGGADRGKFTLTSAGVLAFASAQDFENPDDADTNGIYAVAVAVSDGALTVTANLTVTLTNVNEAPTADAGAGQTGIARGATVTLSGSGSDPDAGDTLSYAWTQTGGESVRLANARAATATFTVPSDLSEMGILTFTLRVTDEGGLHGEDTVTLTVASQPPVITSATSLTVAENQTAVATLTATDVDTPDANLTWTIPADAAGGADRGKFTLSSAGVLAFASAKDFENPDDADTNGIYAVTVAVSDGALTDTANLTVTLTNANDAPTADAGDDQTGIAPSAVVTLSGSGSDQDAGDTLSYAWTQTGSQVGTLTDANAATATFTAPSDLSQIGTLTFTLRVTDQGGLYGEDTVTLTVVSQPPVITSATSLTVAENQTAVAALTATDTVTSSADLAWSIPADAAGGADRGKFTLSSAGVLAFASAQDFENPDDADTNGIYAVTVAVSDGALTATANLTVTLTNVNEAPTADAGADRTGIVQSAVVTLSGSGSDPDAGDTLSYLWTQTGSQEGTLTNANAATATYTAPAAVTQATALTFTLRVTDAGDLFHEDTVTVTVNPVLTAQFENAPVNHDRQSQFTVDLRFSENVLLNATAFSNGLLTITGGTRDGQRKLTEGSSIAWQIDVTPDDNNDVIITLPANRSCNPHAAPCTPDGRQLSAAASVTVTVEAPPVLTGSRTLRAAENQTAVATLTATDDETPVADLEWFLPTGQFGGADQGDFTLSDDGVLAFVLAQDFEYPEDANADGRYEVIVQIKDGDRHLSTPALTVILTNVNEEPTADAGADQNNVVQGAAVTLRGSGSDPDAGDTLSYAWTSEELVTLMNSNAATATFTAPAAVTEATTLTFTLRVTDEGGLHHEDTVTVTVEPQPPVIASATSLTVEENQTAVATLMATDADTPDADLTWSIPSGDAVGADGGEFTLNADGVLAFASEKDFEIPDDADMDGSYAVTVEVSDGDLTVTADLTVTLTNVNEAPTADAGADQTDAVPGATVTLSGSGSDPDAGDTLSYAWAQTGEATVMLTDANAATATFIAPSDSTEPVTLTFTLRVTDGDDLFHEDTVTVTVAAAGALALSLDTIAGDDTINIAEQAAGFTISGDTGTEAGVSVTVAIGTGSLSATSADDNGTATWSVSVPADASYITGPSVSVSVSAAKTGFTAPAAITRTLTVDLTAPTAPTYTAPASLQVGVAITAMSPTGSIGIDAYSATGLLPGLSIDTGTGVIGGTPDTPDANTADATVTVSDAAGNTAEVSITFPAVVKGDQTLTGFQYSAPSVAFGSAAPTVTAPGGVETTLSYSATPSTACTVDPSSGALTLAGVGSCVITATAASTANYNEATATFTVAVQAVGALALNLDAVATDNTVNVAEQTAGFAISGDTGSQAGVSVTVTVGTTELTATSAEADPATWSVSVPAGASYITGTSVDVAVNASKTGYTSPSAVQRTLTVDLTAPTAPTYTVPASLKVGVAITAMDPSGGIGIDAYSATGLLPGLSIDTGTGVIGGTPDTPDANAADATVTASDTAGNTAEVSITFPAVVKGDQTLTGFQYSAPSVAFGSAAPTVTAPGGVETTLSYSATPSTACTVDPSSGALTLAGVGSCVITATAASTANYNEATATFTVAVQAVGALALNLDAVATDNTVNVAEQTAGFAISGDTGSQAGVSVTVTVGTTELTATSAEADPATWSVSVPAGASYITGTSVDVAVNASKTGYTSPSAVERTLTVDLTAPTAPTYTVPASLQVDVAITAMSPSGGIGIDAYNATGLPSGLGIDTGTGVIGGTPDTPDANAADATVTASDTAGNTAEVSITFPAVAKGDQTLTGFQYSAPSVAFGSAAPTVTAPGGVETTLSYSATPSTACTVDPSSGALTLAGVGSCVITATAASTANYNEATATFTVAVQAVGALALNLDAVATDNTVNIAEQTAGFAISGDTGSQAGVSVTVTVGATELTATSAEADPATWSVSVPADASYITGTSVDVAVNASKAGYTSPSAVERTLTVDLTAPTAPTYTVPASLQVDVAITAMSPSGGIGIDAYNATGLPSGLGIDTGTGVIGGTPDTPDANAADATVTASDTAGNTAEVSITFPAVAKGDQTLTGFQYSAPSVAFGSAAPTVTAPGGVETTLSYSATPSTACTVDPSSGALTLAGVGSCVITATAASTANYNEATATFTVAVQAVGALALNLDAVATDNTVNIAEQTAGFAISGDTGSQAGVSVTVTVGATELTATSAEADPATWSVSVPADASYITGTSVDVAVNASKAGYTSPSAVERTLTVDLTAPTAPTYTVPASLQVDVAITAMSPSGGIGIDAYNATGLPSGLGIDTGTGVIGGTPDTPDANAADATVTASDTAGNTAEVSITFPAVAKGDQTLTGFQYSAPSVAFGSAAPTVTAPGGVETTLSYSATPSTACTVDPSSGALTLAGVGSCVITATAASTANYNEATATFTVAVQAVGALALNLDAVATDNTVNIAAKAAGFTISGDTGTESGVDVTVQIGTETLTATSADNAGTATWSVSVPADASYIMGASLVVEVNATKTGYTAPDNVERTLTVDLTAPTAPTYTVPASLQVGVAITAMSPSGGIGIDAYSATGLPPGLSIDTGTGAISGTPVTAETNTASVTVTASDTAGNTAEVSITFPAVAKGDQTLTGFQYSASSVAFGSTAPTVTDPTGVQTTLSYSATPAAVCTVNSSTGALTLAGVGSCVITATAAGAANYNEATATFTVAVQAAGALVLNLDVVATDNTVNIAAKAVGFTISGDTGTESGVDVTVQIGTETLTATSADNAGTATWSVSVPADASYITGPSVDVTVSATKTGFTAPGDVQRTLTVDLTAPTAPTYTVPGSLKVGVAITAMSPSGGIGIDAYSATGLPPGLSIDTGTGAISGTPDTAEANTASVTVTASDTAGNTAEVSITFPAVAKGDQTLTGFQYSASSVAFGSTAPTVTDPTGVQTTLSYSATPAAVCTVNSSTGALTLAGVGSCVITATAAGTDDYNEAPATFTVTVQAAGALVLNLDVVAIDNTVNIAEKTAGFTISGDTGSQGGVSVTVAIGTGSLSAASADDNGTATWSVSVPADASYITGTSVDVTVSATKTGFTAPGNVQRTLTVDLTAPTAPTYTVPGSLKVGVAITAMSPSGSIGIDAYNATGLPPGLSIDTGTGAISGTPDTAEANTASVTVTASDTAGNTAEVSITFPAVAKGDQTLTGFQYSASSVAFGSTAPTVTDPTGVQTTLSYSATPAAVCTVNSSTGALTLAGVGSCVITATAAGTDDYNEAPATFTVTVQAAGALVLNLDTIATDDTVNIAEKATGFTISGDTGTESGIDVTVQIGTETLTATSADNAGTATWSVSVPAGASYITGTSVDVQVNASKTGYTAPNNVERTLTVNLTAPTAPTYTAPALLKVGVAITAMSPTGSIGIDAYSATGLPPGLSIDTGTGVIGGTPDTPDANTADATVTVSDAAGNTAEVSITFPAVAKGDQTLTGFQYSAPSVAFGSAAPTVTAPGGVETTLSYSATPSAVCTVDPSSGALTLAGVGSCVITATAAGTDDYNEATATFTVAVQAVGALVLNLDVVATDNTVNIAAKAVGFTISGDTGTESGVDVTVQIGTETLTATSADNAGTATWSTPEPPPGR